MEILKLINEADTDAISKIIKERLNKYECTVEIGPTYDTDHNLVLVHTTIPTKEVVKTWREIIVPLSGEIEKKFGEAIWEWFGLCNCGNKARLCGFLSDADSDYCCICSECDSKNYRETRELDKCRVCGKEYDVYKDGYYSVNFEARITDETKSDKKTEEKEENDGNEDDGNYQDYLKQEEEKLEAKSLIYEPYIKHRKSDDFNAHECCSKECAKNAYIGWLSRVLQSPYTKECLQHPFLQECFLPRAREDSL